MSAPGPHGARATTEVRPVAPTEKVGLVIDGRYRIEGLIGRGGMGSVYRAEHVTIRRRVAIKLLHPTMAQVPEISKRFEREAYAIGRIEHPNCVNVSDFGTLDDGSLYLVMEYLEGRSLGDELEEEVRLDPMRALHILRHMLRGLGHAHESGIVHRDIKPENVLLIEHDGDPDFAKILDFGIAKLVGVAAETEDADHKLTQAGVAFGTPVYMSPEQAVGNPVDGQADLYAAAVVAYEMITGVTPFQSDDKIEILSMHTTRPVPAMRESAPGLEVSPAIENVIRKGLEKLKKKRYADARDFIRAIDEVLYADNPSARPPTFYPTRRATTGDPSGAVPELGRPRRAGTAPVTYGRESGETQLPVPAPTRRNGLIVAAALGGVTLLALLIAFATGGGDDDDDAGGGDDEMPAMVVEEKSLSKRAAELIEKGDPAAAIALLRSNSEAIAEDGDAQLQLGHAHAFKRQGKASLAAYRRAIALSPAARVDETLERNVELMLDEKNPMVVLDAAALLANELQNADAARKVVELASTSKNMEVRHRALEIAEELGIGDQVDRVESFKLDLIQGAPCKVRKEAVAKLRALGDKRAIEYLEAAKFRRGKRGKYRRMNINRCLRDDAIEAVAYLKSLPGPMPEPESAASGDDDGESP